MRRLALAFGMCVLMSIPAMAQDTRNADVEDTISRQIDAFRADDFEMAFTFASPTIKRLFGTSERFGTMVRQGYPMVWRPADVRFLDLDDMGAFMLQKVLITDMSGVPYTLEYQMIRTENGWQINGVRILDAPQVGA